MFKAVKELVKRGIRLLVNPEKEFRELEKETLETAVANYLKLLIVTGTVAGASIFLFNFARALYYQLSLRVDVQYLRLLNYSATILSTTIFFYAVIGTFGIFFLSYLLRLFIRSIKYTVLVKLMLYSLTPILLFGWIPTLVLSLIIWSIFLFVLGLISQKSSIVPKDSIEQRD